MTELKASVIIDLAGNLQQRAHQYEQSTRNFARNGSRALGLLRMSAQGAGRVMDRLGNRYVAIVSGGTIVAAAKQVGDLSAQLNQMGIDAGFNGDELLEFKKKSKATIQDVAGAWGVGTEQIVAGLSDIVQKTGDIEFATKNTENLAKAVRATGAAGGDIGRILAEFQKMGETDPANVMKLLDTLVIQGKTGAFTLKDLAGLGERVFAAYTPKNIAQVKEMGAVLQILRASAGSPEQAVTSFEGLIRALNDAQTAGRLQKAGIKLFDPAQLKKGRHELLPLATVINNIVKGTRGDRLKLDKLIPDAEATRGLTRLLEEYKSTGQLQSLSKLLGISGDGTQIVRDATDNMREFNAQLNRVTESIKKFADSNLAGHLGDIADKLQNLSADQLNEILETTKQWAFAVGGVLLAYQGIKMVATTINAVSTIKGVAGSAQKGGAGMAIPVYIVDGPASTYNSGNGVPTPAGTPPGNGGLAAWLVRATEVGAVYYGTQQIYKDLADFISVNTNRDAARAELQNGINNAPSWLGGGGRAKLEIEVKGVAPKNLSVREVMSGSGLDVDVQAAVMGLR